MSDVDTESEALVEAARALRTQIRACADQAERDRELPQSLVDAMAEAGFFRLLVPKALGGGEGDPLTLVRVIEAVSEADGSAGWCAMVGAVPGIQCGWLRDDVAAEIYARPNSYVAGVVRRTGQAVAVDGGYRVSGRWAFASGCRHATWLWVNCELYDGAAPRLGADGKTLGRFMFLPRAGVEIVDTWHASGMRGTGSHDIVADDVFVPEEHSMSAQEPLCRPEPLYALGAGWPLMHLAAAAVPLGIARHAIDALVEVASTKTPHLGGGLLAERPITQARVGQAEAHLRAGRAFLFEIVRETWQAVCQIGALTAEQRAPVRLAAVEATSLAVQATELMHRAAGSTAILSSSPLDRCWRDIQAASRNIGINEDHFTAVGRSFLSLDP